MHSAFFNWKRIGSIASLIVISMVASLVATPTTIAQVVVPDREAADLFRQRQALVDERLEELERAFKGEFEALDEFDIPQIMLGGGLGGGSATSISVSEVDGVRTTEVVSDGQRYTIKEATDSIEVTYSKVYGPEDLEALKQDHPDLHMHVVSFPKESQGAAVELSIAIKTTRQAANSEELKEKFPEAYSIYEKFGQQRGLGMRIRADAVEIAPRLREGIKMRRIKPVPDFFERFNRDAIEDEDQPEEDEPPKRRRTIKT